MNAVGIDVSSRKSTVAVLRPLGEVVCLPFDVTHDIAGLASLVEKLKALDGETRVVMEHTGRYYEAVEKALHEAGLFVCAVNPLLIKEYGANSLRRVKTDKADAIKIARYALDNWADLRDFTPMDAIRYDLKTLNRQFQLASKQRTASANNLIALLEQSFPGIRKCFDSPVRSDGTQKWVDFAHSFWHVDCVRKQPFPAFCERYRKWCKLHAYFFKLRNAEKVYALAKSAVVLTPKSKVVKVLVQEAANQLSSISRSVEVYRAEMDRLAAMLPEYPVVMAMYALESPTGRSLWRKSAMFAALNGSRLSLPLLVLTPCLTSPETKTSEATNLLNEALPTSAKPFLMSLELTCNVLPKMNLCFSSLTGNGRKASPSMFICLQQPTSFYDATMLSCEIILPRWTLSSQ